MIAIFKRELKAYFNTPVGFIFMGFLLLISGVFFTTINLFQASPNYNGLLDTITFVFMLVVPILTMRLLAEEAKLKTDQLLLTSPVSVTDIVVGKYLAAVAVFLITLLVTCIYPFLLNFFGYIPVAQIFSAYLGFFLLGASFTAVGLFISACTENQVVAAVATFTTLLLIWIVDLIQQTLPNSTSAGIVFVGLIVLGLAFFTYNATKNRYLSLIILLVGAVGIAAVYGIDRSAFDGIILKVVDWFSLYRRYYSFSQGNLSLSGLVYYVSFAAAFVFLTVQKIEKRRWS